MLVGGEKLSLVSYRGREVGGQYLRARLPSVLSLLPQATPPLRILALGPDAPLQVSLSLIGPSPLLSSYRIPRMRVQIPPSVPHLPLPMSNSLKGTTAAGPAPGLARGRREKGRGREGLGVVVLLARE